MNTAMTQATLLVVEDEKLVRDLLKDKFEESGYQVLEAGNGAEGLAHLHQSNIDLVISDLVMPDTDGLELLMAMRTEWPDIPMIAITAPSNQIYLEVASRLGAARTFEKPLDLAQIESAVDALLA